MHSERSYLALLGSFSALSPKFHGLSPCLPDAFLDCRDAGNDAEGKDEVRIHREGKHLAMPHPVSRSMIVTTFEERARLAILGPRRGLSG